jgi:hypothetical protein
MSRMPRFSAAPLLLLIALVVACSSPTGDGGNPPPVHQQPQITGATLISGGDGSLTGVALDQLPASLTVDGSTVTPTYRSATEIRFPMPKPRICETDGRSIQIQAGTVAYSAPLAVPGVLRLDPAESRLITVEEMATACLMLPATAASYVLTAVNPSLLSDGGADQLFTVQTWTGSGGAAAAASFPDAAKAPTWPGHRAEQNRPRFGTATVGTHRYVENPILFDPRYATATEGDTVPWVDFRSPDWTSRNRCTDPRAAIPTFGAVVTAVSASGKTVIAYDARSAHANTWSSPESRARLRRLADIIERWGPPALREVYGASYQPPAGAGGRWWHIFRTGLSYPTVDDAAWPQTMCAHYSEVTTTLAPDVPLTDDRQVETVAGYLIHELGHLGEDVYAVRRWGNVFARGPSAWGSVSEAWAQTVSESAARLASNQPTAARYDRAAAPGVPFADFYTTGYGEQPETSPWGGGSRGPYDAGARILMFLREQWGDAAIGAGKKRFYGEVMDLPTYDFASMASLVGLSPSAALDRWSLAEATDDLVDPGAAAARGLPQLATWAPQDQAPLPSVSLGRSMNATRRVNVGRGNYAALYLMGTEGPDAGKGVSITFRDVGSAPFIARITRLR